MKRTIYILLVIAGVLLAWKLYDKYVPSVEEEEVAANYQVFNRIFEDLGISGSQCIIDGYYYYSDDYISEDSAHEMLESLLRDIGVTSDYEYFCNRTEGITTNMLKTSGERFKLELSVLSVCQNKQENVSVYKQYLSVHITVADSIESGYYYRSIVDRTVDKLLGRNEDVSMVIKGQIKGNMNLERQREMANAVFLSLQAETVYENTGIDGEDGIDSYNIYGYTNEMKESIKLAGEKINVNVAFNYNENEDVTYIHVGMPIVNYEY